MPYIVATAPADDVALGTPAPAAAWADASRAAPAPGPAARVWRSLPACWQPSRLPTHPPRTAGGISAYQLHGTLKYQVSSKARAEIEAYSALLVVNQLSQLTDLMAGWLG